jgi:DNA gyrase subunit B
LNSAKWALSLVFALISFRVLADIYVEKEQDGVGVEIALQYIDDLSTKIAAYANNIPNSEGGTHVTGFKTSLTRLINSYARKNNILKEKEPESEEDEEPGK